LTASWDLFVQGYAILTSHGNTSNQDLKSVKNLVMKIPQYLH